MSALVRSEIAAFCTSIVAIVAGERTLAEMNTLVTSQSAFLRTLKVAFVASEWTLAGMNRVVIMQRICFSTLILARVSKVQHAANAIISQFICRSMHARQFPAFEIGCRFVDIAFDWFFIVNFTLKRFLDSAYNQILPRLEIACEFRLKRAPNVARRKSPLRAYEGTGE